MGNLQGVFSSFDIQVTGKHKKEIEPVHTITIFFDIFASGAQSNIQFASLFRIQVCTFCNIQAKKSFKLACL